MRQLANILAALVLLCGLIQSPAAIAQEAGENLAIRNVITRQLDAFLADDAQRAYSFAAPGIQRLFPGEERFMGMVRQGYPPVYRPRSRDFGALRQTPQGPVQEVILIDANGQAWLALYTMEQQPDGSWKIAGVRLVRENAVAA
ncbi:DUF4864 domain-containing protein [Saliniramus sp.]|uniref:DUF4864 domain-containing protein n=1 Tax=Saliniramus sp. TaxID=2986772 RepID=UPI002B5F5820|nr:DUF4864 domain-containing protein [Saliniramus sp.]HMB12190.1 DUF4864 domain-containing protein [Saliniramus sp.]